MGMNNSSLIYFNNYYLLEQTRAELHIYLERLVTMLADEVEAYLDSQYNEVIRFRKYVQKNGGYAEFVFESKVPLPGIDEIEQWKFYIAYKDATKTEQISKPTNCIVYCNAPKSHAKQNYELSRIASKLGFHDIYRVLEFSLIGDSMEEIISPIKAQFIEFYDQFIQMVDALVKEGTQL